MFAHCLLLPELCWNLPYSIRSLQKWKGFQSSAGQTLLWDRWCHTRSLKPKKEKKLADLQTPCFVVFSVIKSVFVFSFGLVSFLNKWFTLKNWILSVLGCFDCFFLLFYSLSLQSLGAGNGLAGYCKQSSARPNTLPNRNSCISSPQDHLPQLDLRDGHKKNGKEWHESLACLPEPL